MLEIIEINKPKAVIDNPMVSKELIFISVIEK